MDDGAELAVHQFGVNRDAPALLLLHANGCGPALIRPASHTPSMTHVV
jgi:hypothetical protein